MTPRIIIGERARQINLETLLEMAINREQPFEQIEISKLSQAFEVVASVKFVEGSA